MNTLKTFTAVVVVAAVSAASAANFQSLTSAPGVAQHVFGDAPAPAGNVENVAGDTVNVAVTAFNSGGGAFLSGAATHTVGDALGNTDIVPSGAAGIIPDHFITTFVTDVGTTRTLEIIIDASVDFSVPLAPAGLLVAGAPITDFFFEIPDLNGGPDLFDDPDKIGPATGDFFLIGGGGATLFSTAAGIDDFGTSYSVGNGISVGGADPFDPAVVGDIIAGGAWRISYEIVPEPASLLLLAFGALAIRRR